MSNRIKDMVIYKATNVFNNKMYIGFCVYFKERKARHLRSAEKGVITKFYNAIRKHGKDNFIWEIIEKDIESLSKLKEREIFYIKLFDTYNTGYNSTLGGDGGFTGHNSGQFKKGVKPWCTGIKLSENHINNLRKSHIGKKQSSYTVDKRIKKMIKPVVRFSLNNEFIQEYSSLSEAALSTGTKMNSIGCVCANKTGYKSAGGFKWKFKKDYIL